MMFSLTGYVCRRHWKKFIVFVAAVLILSLYTLIFMAGELPATTAPEMNNGRLEFVEANRNLRIYDDPGNFTSYPLMAAFVGLLAFWMVWKERRFLCTLSLTRRQVTLGTAGAMMAASVCMAAAGFAVPALGRLVLWACGFGLRAPWSWQVILFGGDSLWWQDILYLFCLCLLAAGSGMFFGSVWVRWWKLWLILLAAGVGLIYLLAAQIHWSSVLGQVEAHIEDILIWTFYVAIPNVLDFYTDMSEHFYLRCAACAGSGALLCLLSYPVTRGMKIIK